MEEKKLEFPLVFPKCPACGCDETVAIRAAKDEGLLIDEKTPPFMSTSATPVMNPTVILQKITAKVLLGVYDVCTKCGCYYCIRVEQIMANVQVQPNPPQKPPWAMPGLGPSKQ